MNIQISRRNFLASGAAVGLTIGVFAVGSIIRPRIFISISMRAPYTSSPNRLWFFTSVIRTRTTRPRKSRPPAAKLTTVLQVEWPV